MLLVSTDDCHITAWGYEGGSFKTLNPIGDVKQDLDIKVLKSMNPQFCMAWDEI